MNGRFALALLAVLIPAAAAAQSPSATPAAARRAVPPAGEQVAAAVLPLPEEFRAGATVLGYAPDGRLSTLRRGAGPFICLANDPSGERFHVACYHRSLEPFMARGRALRARGIRGDKVDTVRFAEVRAGSLALPKQPAALYTLTGPAGAFDPSTGTAAGARPLFAVYVPYATAQSTGLPARPVEGSPWIMDAGTPKAHLMFVPGM
jgi:hypothetical protein